MSAPLRPRLGHHISARRHVADGERFVLLHDRKVGQIHRVTERAWALLNAMDGTRDPEGLAVAAQLRRLTVDPAEAQAFTEDVSAAGLLAEEGAAETPTEDGPENASAAGPPVVPPLVAPDRLLDVLPGYRLDCDGTGSCCRLFPTIAFLPRDVAAARAILPDVLHACDDEHRAFTPSQGSRHTLSVVTLVNGRCGYLEADGRCGIHAASDASFKPFGCRTFPLSFIDDGTSIRVVPRPECACVPRSAKATGGAPLLPEEVRARGDLPLEIYVHEVPDPVPLAEERTTTRDAYARWSRRISELETSDAAAALAALADAVAARGLDEEADAAILGSPPPLEWSIVAPRLVRLRAGAAKRAGEGFRSVHDLAHRSFVALETACDLALAAPDVFASGARLSRDAGAESFHLRAMLFGHLLWQLDTTTHLADGLRGLAARIVAARALGAVAELGELVDPAFAWPLSLVEALARAYALEEGALPPPA